MHYYQFNIGDYRRDTNHLTLLEHGAYRQLLDQYYLKEEPILVDIEMRTLCACNADEVKAVEYILNKYFILTDAGYIHSACDEVIEKYKNKSESARKSAKARWNNKLDKDTNAMRTHSDGNANHKPLTTNHKPIKKKSENKFSDADISFAKFMYEKILIIAERTKEPNFESWANTIRLMRQIDNYDPGEIQQVFCWANIDTFWQSNIKSPTKLRDQYATLQSQMKKPREKTIQEIQANLRGGRIHEQLD